MKLLSQTVPFMKFHRIYENTPLTVQVHCAIVPGQRGLESEALQEKVWAPAEGVIRVGKVEVMRWEGTLTHAHGN